MERHLSPRIGRAYGTELLDIPSITSNPARIAELVNESTRWHQSMQQYADDGGTFENPQIDTNIAIYGNAMLEFPI